MKCLFSCEYEEVAIYYTEENWPLILTAIRQRLGASQYDLSRFSGLTQSKIARVEKKKAELSFKDVRQLSNLLGVTTTEFASGRFATNERMRSAFEIFGLQNRVEPKKYVLSRVISPILSFILEELGDKSVLELMHDLGLTEETIVFKDTKIELQLFHIFISALFDNNIISKTHFKEIANRSFCPDTLGETTFEKIHYEANPFKRLQLHFFEGPGLENFSKVHFNRTSKTNAIIQREFRSPVQPSEYSINGLKDTCDRHLWCEYFTFHLKSLLKGSSLGLYFDVQKFGCQWEGDSHCHYELQIDY